MYKCFCGKEYKTRSYMSSHLTLVEKLSGLEKEEKLMEIIYGKEKIAEAISRYLNKEISAHGLYNEGIHIKKYLKLLGIKRTHKEEFATSSYKQRLKNSIKEKYGVENASQSKEIKIRKKNTFIERYGVIHNFRIKETIEKANKNYQEKTSTPEYKKAWIKKYKKTCQEKYGVDNVSQDTEIKSRMIATKKERMAKMSLEERRKMTENARNFWNEQNSWTSNIEIRIHLLLDSLNIKYQKHVSLYGYNYDIVIKNIIIEINGDFWHGNPMLYKEDDMLFPTLSVKEVWDKDARKKEVAEKNKKKVYILWENDIMNSSDQQLIEVLKKWIP